MNNNSEKYSAAFQACLNTFSRYKLRVNPVKINHALTGGLLLLAIGASTYWFMQILQTPNPPDAASNAKGITLAGKQNTVTAHALFGEKPIAAQNIFLRGIVITAKNATGTFDGFAIFEINSKPTTAIAIGESLGNGLILKSIKPDSATLLYQGQEMEFMLTKKRPQH